MSVERPRQAPERIGMRARPRGNERCAHALEDRRAAANERQR